MVLRKLLISNLTTRKLRTALTISAIALSVSLVVAVTTGYKSAEGSIFNFLVTYLGSTDVQVAHKNDFRQGPPERILPDIRKDKDVNRAYGRLETETSLLDQSGKVILGRSAQLIGVDRPDDIDVSRTPVDAGEWFDGKRQDVAVIDQKAADTLGVKVGGKIMLPAGTGGDGKREFTVVGLCHKPAILGEKVSWIYLPIGAVQELTARKGELTRIMVDLKEGASDQAFADRWNPQLEKINPSLKMRFSRDLRKEMDQKLEGMHFLSFLGGAISMLAAMFIVFSALSMGVTERQRTLAMLRAIGADKGQVGRLVVAEGLYLGILGIVIGIPLGILWAWTLTKWKADWFTAGLFIDWMGILIGGVGSVLSAVIAGIMPAWAASRVSPLEAMSPLAKPPVTRLPIWMGLLGLLLIFIDTITIFSPQVPREIKFYSHFVLGLPGVFLGFFLISPLFVRAVEALLASVAGRMLGVQPNLLRQQLSGGLWRAAGTGTALMVGLAFLIAMQTVGNSMLNGWKLPVKFPDIFIYSGQGLEESQWKKLHQVEGIKKGEVMPIALAFPGLPKGMFGILGAAIIPDATMYLGCDPNLLLDMMELEFRDGNKADAKAGLLKGDHVIVTDEFRVLRGLKVGDKLPLATDKGMKDFTICGVVWSPGMDVMVTMFDLGRMFEQRTAFSVFGTSDDAKKHFGTEKVSFFAANLELGLEKEVLLKRVKEQLGEKGWFAGDVRKIKSDIIGGFRKMLLLLTTVAFAAMAVAALGVTNTVMASVRSRLWQFGILRSIGVTRGQLVRLVVAEALLLGLVGCIMGLLAGFLMAYNAMGLSRYVLGYITPMTPAWPIIIIGVGVIMAVSVLASIWPAVSVAKAEPLSLLQGGRSSI